MTSVVEVLREKKISLPGPVKSFFDEFRLNPSLSGLTLSRVHLAEEKRPITDFIHFFTSVDVNRNKNKKIRNDYICKATIPTILPDLTLVLSRILALIKYY